MHLRGFTPLMERICSLINCTSDCNTLLLLYNFQMSAREGASISLLKQYASLCIAETCRNKKTGDYFTPKASASNSVKYRISSLLEPLFLIRLYRQSGHAVTSRSAPISSAFARIFSLRFAGMDLSSNTVYAPQHSLRCP